MTTTNSNISMPCSDTLSVKQGIKLRLFKLIVFKFTYQFCVTKYGSHRAETYKDDKKRENSQRQYRQYYN